jgi:hypothetical protein
MSPRRDLSKPLVDVDPTASFAERLGATLVKRFVPILFGISLFLMASLLVVLAVIFLQ